MWYDDWVIFIIVLWNIWLLNVLQWLLFNLYLVKLLLFSHLNTYYLIVLIFYHLFIIDIINSLLLFINFIDTTLFIVHKLYHILILRIQSILLTLRNLLSIQSPSFLNISHLSLIHFHFRKVNSIILRSKSLVISTLLLLGYQRILLLLLCF